MDAGTLPTTRPAIETPYIRVTFPVQGHYLPADHGYLLYAAITKCVPSLHGVSWLGTELISGLPQSQGLLALPAHGGEVRLRIPADKLAYVLPLAGTYLNLDGSTLRLGLPVAHPVVPAPSLYARIVTIKKFTEPESFLVAAQRQLAQLDITGSLELPQDGRSRHRRILTIHGRKVVGFSLAAHGLSEDGSIRLQTVGLGGRRAMGCGLFNPIRRAT